MRFEIVKKIHPRKGHIAFIAIILPKALQNIRILRLGFLQPLDQLSTTSELYLDGVVNPARKTNTVITVESFLQKGVSLGPHVASNAHYAYG